jgi:hypothetical protein
MMIGRLTLAAFLLLPAMAQAARPGSAMEFAAVLQNPGHRQTVLEAARDSPAWTHMSCPGARFAQAPEVGVYLPVVFDKSGVPVSGEWREGLTVTGCGAPMTLNVLTQISAPATLATGYLLPGSTIADPILQNYAQRFALKAAGGLPAGCKDGYVANTEFAGYEGADAAQQTGPWREIWTLDLCGPPERVMMHFIVGAGSVAIDAEPYPATGGQTGGK